MNGLLRVPVGFVEPWWLLNENEQGVTGSGGDTTPPVISTPTAAALNATTAFGQFTTDEANGTGYVVATASATTPSEAQIVAGQDHLGAAADGAASQPVTATGVQGITVTDLTPGATRYLHFFHDDAAGNGSNRITSASFALPAASSGGITTATGITTITVIT